eukprot:4749557-Alexandrium_andersonii.AAC.1
MCIRDSNVRAQRASERGSRGSKRSASLCFWTRAVDRLLGSEADPEHALLNVRAARHVILERRPSGSV